MVGFFAILMFQHDVVLTLCCIGFGVMNLVINKWVARKRVDGSRRLLQESGKLMGTAMGGLQTIETLKATGGEGDFFRALGRLSSEVACGKTGAWHLAVSASARFHRC